MQRLTKRWCPCAVVLSAASSLQRPRADGQIETFFDKSRTGLFRTRDVAVLRGKLSLEMEEDSRTPSTLNSQLTSLPDDSSVTERQSSTLLQGATSSADQGDGRWQIPSTSFQRILIENSAMFSKHCATRRSLQVEAERFNNGRSFSRRDPTPPTSEPKRKFQPVCRKAWPISNHNKPVVWHDPVSSEISNLCEFSDLLLLFSYSASQNKEIKSGN